MNKRQRRRNKLLHLREHAEAAVYYGWVRERNSTAFTSGVWLVLAAVAATCEMWWVTLVWVVGATVLWSITMVSAWRVRKIIGRWPWRVGR